MSEVLIRRFIKDDQDEVAKIFRQGFESYNHLGNDSATLGNWFAIYKLKEGGEMSNIYDSFHISANEDETDRNFWVATLNNEVVGCVGAIPSEEHKDDGIELIRMSVKSGNRGHGIGSKLISHLLNWTLSKGKRKVLLSTKYDMESAIILYLKNEFHITHVSIYDVTLPDDPDLPLIIDKRISVTHFMKLLL